MRIPHAGISPKDAGAAEGVLQSAVDGFTADQRFFIAFARVWGTQYRDEAKRLQIILDSLLSLQQGGGHMVEFPSELADLIRAS